MMKMDNFNDNIDGLLNFTKTNCSCKIITNYKTSNILKQINLLIIIINVIAYIKTRLKCVQYLASVRRLWTRTTEVAWPVIYASGPIKVICVYLTIVVNREKLKMEMYLVIQILSVNS